MNILDHPWIRRSVIAANLAFAATFLLVAHYSRMASDDFCATLTERQTFLQFHELNYFYWMGAWMNTTLGSLFTSFTFYTGQKPLAYHAFALTMMTAALAFLIGAIGARFMSGAPPLFKRVNIALFLLACLLLASPEQAKAEVWFWQMGSISYFIALIPAMLLTGLLLDPKDTPLRRFFAGLCAFAIPGFILVYGCMLLFLLLTARFRGLWGPVREDSPLLAPQFLNLLLILALTSFFINLLAPGNFTRESLINTTTLADGILKTLLVLKWRMAYLVENNSLWLAVHLLFWFAAGRAQLADASPPQPRTFLLVIACGTALLLGAAFVVVYPLGSMSPRTQYPLSLVIIVSLAIFGFLAGRRGWPDIALGRLTLPLAAGIFVMAGFFLFQAHRQNDDMARYAAAWDQRYRGIVNAFSRPDGKPVHFNRLAERSWLFYPTTSDVQYQDYLCLVKALGIPDKGDPRVILDAVLLEEQKVFD